MDCIIVGGGPSVTLEMRTAIDCSGRKVIGINEVWKHVKCWMLALCDQDAADRNHNFPGVVILGGETFMVRPNAMHFSHADLVTDDFSKGLYRGSSTGAFALNFALCVGFERIFLFGFDCGAGPDGSTNFYNTMQEKGFQPPASNYENMVNDFERFRRYADRIRLCTPSRIQTFEIVDWREAIAS